MNLAILLALFLITSIHFQGKASNLRVNRTEEHSMKELQSEGNNYKVKSFSYEYLPKNYSAELLDENNISLIASSEDENKMKLFKPLIKAPAKVIITNTNNLNPLTRSVKPVKPYEIKSKIGGNINPYLTFGTLNSDKAFMSDNFSTNINGKINLKIEKDINGISYGANTQLSSPTVKHFVTADNNTLTFFTSSKYGKFSLGYQNGVEKSLGVDATKLEAGHPITPRSSQLSDFYTSPVLYSESIANSSNKYVLTDYKNKNFTTTTPARISFESTNIKGFRFGISYAPFGYNKNLFIRKTSDEVQKLKKELTEANATIKKKSYELRKAIEEKKVAEEEYIKDEQMIDRLAKEKEKALEDFQITRNLLQEEEAAYATLQAQEQQDQKTIHEKEENLVSVQNELTKSQKNLKTAQDALKEKQDAYDKLKAQETKDQADLEKAHEDLVEAKDKINEATQAKDKVEEQLAKTQSELDAANASKDATEQALATSQNNLSEAKKALSLAESKAEEAQQKLDDHIKQEEEKKQEKQTTKKDLSWGIRKNKNKNVYNYFKILDSKSEEIDRDTDTGYNVQVKLKSLIHNDYDEFKIAYKEGEVDYPLGYLIAKPSKAKIEISGKTEGKRVFGTQIVEVDIEPVEIEAEIAIDGRIEKENTVPFHDMIINTIDSFVKGVKDIYFIPTSADGDEEKANVYVIQVPKFKVPEIHLKSQDIKIKLDHNVTDSIRIGEHVFYDNTAKFRRLAKENSSLNYSKVNIPSYMENSEYKDNKYEEDSDELSDKLHANVRMLSTPIMQNLIQLDDSTQLSEKELERLLKSSIKAVQSSYSTATSTDSNEKILFQGPNYKNIISGGINYSHDFKNNVKTKLSITGEYGKSIKHDQLTTKYDTYYEMHDLMAVATGFNAEFSNLSIGGSYGYLGKSGLVKQEYSLDNNGDYIVDNYSDKLVNTTYFTIGTGYKSHNFYSSLVYTHSDYQNNAFNNISVGGEYSLAQTNNINYTFYANYSFTFINNKESVYKKRYSNLATGIEISF